MDASSARYLPLTEEVITSHLAGHLDLGLYPLLPDDSCCWLAADFDEPAAMLDALAYLKAARAARVPSSLEVSRSGVGAHVWTFFASAISAAVARRLGMGLLREAMGIRGRMSLASYDRLLPAQDVLPAGGFGNLIAAPLQGRCRRAGTTVFLDLTTMEPLEDQWAYLSTLDRMSPREVASAAAAVREPVVGARVARLAAATSTRITVPVPPVVHVRLGARVTVDGADLTPSMASTVMHAASLRNPMFDERQRLRRSTWDVPRFLRSYEDTVTGDLVLPRGLFGLVESVAAEQGSGLDLVDDRACGEPIEPTFAGILRAGQAAAVSALLGHDLGVLVAPPGSGKTVIACATAGRVGVPTLVLVDRRTLADQWRGQIRELLGVTAGQLGGGRTKRGGVIDVAMLQTLARRDDVASFTAGYGLVIVDECHHVPAVAFDHVVRQVAADAGWA